MRAACRWCAGAASAALLLAVAGAPLRAATDTQALVLSFEDAEPGLPTSSRRVLVSAEWVRIDAGAGADDGYLLFERSSGRLFSVSHLARTVLHMEPAEPGPAPPGLRLELVRRSLAGAPRVDGRMLAEVRLLAGDEECAGAEIAAGYLDDARVALLAFRRRLVASNQSTLANTPEELRTPCFLGDVYAGDFAYRDGFPVTWWDASGRRRVLVGVEHAATVDSAVWQLPPYRRFSIGE